MVLDISYHNPLSPDLGSALLWEYIRFIQFIRQWIESVLCIRAIANCQSGVWRQQTKANVTTATYTCYGSGQYGGSCAVACPAGKSVTGGGCTVSHPHWQVYASYQSGNAWVCGAFESPGSGVYWQTVTGQVVCG